MERQKPTTNLTQSITTEVEPVKMLLDKDSVETLLETIDPFIQVEVKRNSHGLSPIQIDETIQNVRIKLWKALQKRTIRLPVAYARIIIQNELYTLGRGRKPPETLSLDEYGEIKQGNILVNSSDGWANPEQVVVEREALETRLDMTVEGVAILPPRQQQAMICSLLQRIDDERSFTQALDNHHIPIDLEDWPDNDEEKHRLKASITVARHKIADLMMQNELLITERRTSHTSLPENEVSFSRPYSM